MKITVINGSPKRKEDSVTQRLITLFRRRNPDVEVSTISIGPIFSGLKKDAELKTKWLEEVESADALIWCFPVYYIWLPAQLVRFLELVRRDKNWQKALSEKYATSVTSSINFFDHTAHWTIREMSEDLGMRYCEGFSSDMHSMMKKEGQDRALAFFSDFTAAVKETIHIPRSTQPLPENPATIPATVKKSDTKGGKKVTILTDARPEDTSLLAMIDTFSAASPDAITVCNLNEIGMVSGCIGCLRCSYNNVCTFKDGLKEFILTNCSAADGLVYAFRREGRTFSSTVKSFQDRSFVFNHVPYLQGLKAVWLVDGPLKSMALLQELIRSTAELTGITFAGMTGNDHSPEELAQNLTALGRELHRAIVTDRPAGHTFREIAGRKLFRDFVYLNPIFRKDNIYYKKKTVTTTSRKNSGSCVSSGRSSAP